MRKGPVKKRTIEPDTKYQSTLIAKFVNYLMYGGKKITSRKIVYDALAIAEKKTGKTGIEVMDQVISNVGPQMELRSRRIGGANYQIPYPVSVDRRIALAFRWIIDVSRSKKGKQMSEKLAQELVDAFNNTGSAVKKKLDTHRMADANKAFAHFAW